jgi:Tfp pilus assembly protein PilV
LTWFDQQEEERKKRQQIIQQMLNQTKSQKSYQPDYKGAAAFFGKYEAKQNPKTTTKPKAKTDTSKKNRFVRFFNEECKSIWKWHQE